MMAVSSVPTTVTSNSAVSPNTMIPPITTTERNSVVSTNSNANPHSTGTSTMSSTMKEDTHPQRSKSTQSQGKSQINSSMNSMTIAISPENAKRMLDASRAFNAALKELDENDQLGDTTAIQVSPSDCSINQEDDEDANNKSPDTSMSIETNTTVSPPSSSIQQQQQDSNNTKSAAPLPAKPTISTTTTSHQNKADRFIQAALLTQNKLLTNYVRAMQHKYNQGIMTKAEIETSLLLFLDVDKSSKLLHAFQVLSKNHTQQDSNVNFNCMDSSNAGVKDNNKSSSQGCKSEAEEEDVVMMIKSELNLPPMKSEADSEEHNPEDTNNGTKITKSSSSSSLFINTKDDDEEEQDLDDPNSSHNDSTYPNNAKPTSSSSSPPPSSHPLKPPSLSRENMTKMFQSFLSSISVCIHPSDEHSYGTSSTTIEPHDDDILNHQDSNNNSTVPKEDEEEEDYRRPAKAFKRNERDSPSISMMKSARQSSSPSSTTKTSTQQGMNSNNKEWMSSQRTEKDIHNIASFATSRILDFIAKKRKNTTTTTSDYNEKEDGITFLMFGDWYNSGGFSLVPWLELLHLGKWDYAGKSSSKSSVTRSRASMSASVNSISKSQDTVNANDNPSSNGIQKQNPPISSSEAKAFSTVDNVTSSTTSTTSQDVVKESIPLPQTSNLDTAPKATPTINRSTASQFTFNSPEANTSYVPRTLISFDFEGSSNIKITDENLQMLQRLVDKTALSRCSLEEVFKVMLRHSTSRHVTTMVGASRSEEEMMVLSRDKFRLCIRDLVPPEASKRFTSSDMESFSNFFTNFFLCFVKVFKNATGQNSGDHVNAKELAVGFSLLCKGNKSAKLATLFEVIEEKNSGYLSQRKLLRYLRSYLTMLVGISFLSSSTRTTTEIRKCLVSGESSDGAFNKLFYAAERGARWTLDNFLQKQSTKKAQSAYEGMISFEEFASWYTEGGYSISPWLEFLDLKKFLSLLHENGDTKHYGSVSCEPLVSSPHNDGRIRSFDEFFSGSSPAPLSKTTKLQENPRNQENAADVLYTFPLANRHSLVVLRDDAAYVRTVVSQLGLTSLSPDEVWKSLFTYVREHPPSPLSWIQAKNHKNGTGKSIDVDESTFVKVLENMIPIDNLYQGQLSSSKETLGNFFQSFDLDQVNRVAVNQLMGGLTLLCDGKKSTKLSFAFGLFDGRVDEERAKSNQSLCGKELFYFLRSFLIVMFSCCKQSLDLSAEAVSRYISDTANMVTDNVMKYQWRTKAKDRVDFDEFGEWYNEGGYEIAPWLELLDLSKWVMSASSNDSKSRKSVSENIVTDRKSYGAEDSNTDKKAKKSIAPLSPTALQDNCLDESVDWLPPSGDDLLDDHIDFFDDIAMGDMDDIDLFLDEYSVNGEKNDMDYSHDETTHLPSPKSASNNLTSRFDKEPKPLNFQIITDDSVNPRLITISNRRVGLLNRLVTESELFRVSISSARNAILSEARNGILKKDRFDAAMRTIVSGTGTKMSLDTQRLLSDMLSNLFSAFDLNKSGEVNVKKLACGFTILCGGRKSDKLEAAFDLFDEKGVGAFDRKDMVRYLESFLTVLLSISSCAIGKEPREDVISFTDKSRDRCNTVAQVVNAGCLWAADQVFKSRKGEEYINFDAFAEWYTQGGFNSIPWIELLDLKKWVLV